MRILKLCGALLLLITAVMLEGRTESAQAQVKTQIRILPCSGAGLKVHNVAMNPDPIASGVVVTQWTVQLELTQIGPCVAIIDIWDPVGKVVAGRGANVEVGAGLRAYAFPAVPGYTFPSGYRQKCFEVRIDLSGTPKILDKARPFCAVERWTLRVQ